MFKKDIFSLQVISVSAENILQVEYSNYTVQVVTKTMSFTSIPILDLAQAKDPATKPEFLTQLRHALMEVGFLYLKNVGIPDELFQTVIEQGKAFFGIPVEEKYASFIFPQIPNMLALPTRNLPESTTLLHPGSRLK